MCIFIRRNVGRNVHERIRPLMGISTCDLYTRASEGSGEERTGSDIISVDFGVTDKTPHTTLDMRCEMRLERTPERLEKGLLCTMRLEMGSGETRTKMGGEMRPKTGGELLQTSC